ncbi:MAG: hemerythrin family protein [Gammaproteobacteria bacterium]|nr:hemerythrin family protein [Gammaproteobacteria bacterium]
MDEFFVWSEEYSIGVPAIDKQHKILINIINELNNILMSGADKDDIDKVFDALKVYVQKHFSYEESLMDKYQFPQTSEHHNEHQQLVEKVLDFEKRMNNGNFMIGIELMEFLKNWLMHHVCEVDMQLGQFIQQQDDK